MDLQEIKKGLDDLSFKKTDEIKKAKYIKRTGSPGNYKYEYAGSQGGGNKKETLVDSKESSKHISDMNQSEKISVAKELGIKDPEKLSPKELNKQLVEKNIERQIKEFKEKKKESSNAKIEKITEEKDISIRDADFEKTFPQLPKEKAQEFTKLAESLSYKNNGSVGYINGVNSLEKKLVKELNKLGLDVVAVEGDDDTIVIAPKPKESSSTPELGIPKETLSKMEVEYKNLSKKYSDKGIKGMLENSFQNVSLKKIKAFMDSKKES